MVYCSWEKETEQKMISNNIELRIDFIEYKEKYQTIKVNNYYLKDVFLIIENSFFKLLQSIVKINTSE